MAVKTERERERERERELILWTGLLLSFQKPEIEASMTVNIEISVTDRHYVVNVFNALMYVLDILEKKYTNKVSRTFFHLKSVTLQQ